MAVHGATKRNTKTSPRLLNLLIFLLTSFLLCHSNRPPFTMAPSRLPQKRILGDTTNTRRNIASSPSSAKKRKLEQVEPASSPAARFKSSQNGPKGKLGSSQPSHFESEVLEKMTQDMAGLRKNNSEKDQQWARPSLDDFKEGKDNLIFQQIECEEGTLHGGNATVKLFGVTEASCPLRRFHTPLTGSADWPFCHASRYRLPPLPLCCCASKLHTARMRRLQDLSRLPAVYPSTCHPLCPDRSPRKPVRLSRQPAEPVHQDYSE